MSSNEFIHGVAEYPRISRSDARTLAYSVIDGIQTIRIAQINAVEHLAGQPEVLVRERVKQELIREKERFRQQEEEERRERSRREAEVEAAQRLLEARDRELRDLEETRRRRREEEEKEEERLRSARRQRVEEEEAERMARAQLEKEKDSTLKPGQSRTRLCWAPNWSGEVSSPVHCPSTAVRWIEAAPVRSYFVMRRENPSIPFAGSAVEA